MEKRDLGKSELSVSALCLGGNVFGWTADEGTSKRLLDNFVDVEGNFIDTADVYSKWVPGHEGGESETIIGRWLNSTRKRAKAVIATKVGLEVGPNKKGLSKEHIKRSAEASLRRLQTDYIDLYQAHKDDPETPLSETLEAFAELIQEGKVRFIGASNYPAERLAEALQVSEELRLPRYESLQPEYNLYDRAGFEAELQPLCYEKQIGVIPYYSLASGFLTGKYRSEEDAKDKARGGKVKGYLNERGFKILSGLDQVAKKHGAKPAQIALAWLLTRSTVAAPIASATNLDQLKDLVEAMDMKLENSDVELLNEASA